MNSLHERIDWIKADRRPHTFGEQVGWTRGVVQGAFPSTSISADEQKRRKVPGAEFLGLLCLVENVSMNWLVTGTGNPFNSAPGLSDEAWSARLTLHIEDAENGASEIRLLVVKKENRLATVIYWPEQHCAVGETTPSVWVWRNEICSGQCGNRTSQALQMAAAAMPTTVLSLEETDFDRLVNGQMGNYELFGVGSAEPKGLVAFAQAAQDGDLPGTQITLGSDLSRNESLLIQHFRQLSAAKQTALLNLFDVLTDTPTEAAPINPAVLANVLAGMHRAQDELQLNLPPAAFSQLAAQFYAQYHVGDTVDFRHLKEFMATAG
ncbi:hypothetical protein [Chitinimonas sp.]|uniref:hypothetical protein n=1 Tax=Chitinimonas sp. TaxID=1934313 RepID=UPI0035AEB222